MSNDWETGEDGILYVSFDNDRLFYYSNKDNSMLIITHYQRLLGYIKPDEVHIFYGGKIIKSGDYSLVETLEAKGYEGFL